MERARVGLRLCLAGVYRPAGLFHLFRTGVFVRIVPNWVPMPHATVILTGWCEMLGAGALLTRRLRRLAGSMLALYAVCVFPANIKHAFQHVALGGRTLGWWYHAPRLAFQPVLVWWALFCAGLLSWPFRPRSSAET